MDPERLLARVLGISVLEARRLLARTPTGIQGDLNRAGARQDERTRQRAMGADATAALPYTPRQQPLDPGEPGYTLQRILTGERGLGRERGVGVVDLTPVAGDAIGIAEGEELVQEGHPIMGRAIQAMSALPLVGDVAGPAMRRFATWLRGASAIGDDVTPLMHYSRALDDPSVHTLSPEYAGTGRPGREQGRRGAVHFYEPGVRPERQFARMTSQGIPISNAEVLRDQETLGRLFQQAREETGILGSDDPRLLDRFEELVTESGYKGYSNGRVVRYFDEVPIPGRQDARMRALAEEQGGFTLDPATGRNAEPGIMAAERPGDDFVAPEGGSILEALTRDAEGLAMLDEGAPIGGWVRNGELVGDVIRRFDPNAQGYTRAVNQAIRTDQDGIFDTATGAFSGVMEGARGTEGRVARPELNPYLSARENAERRSRDMVKRQPQVEAEIDELIADMPATRKQWEAHPPGGAIRRRVIEKLGKMPEPRVFASLAMQGAEHRGWYEASARALRDTFGEDSPRFTALLAATSPQKSVPENLDLALEIWDNWTRAGRPPVDRSNVTRFWPEGMTPLDADVGNAARALSAADEAYDAETISQLFLDREGLLSGAKVDAFWGNLLREVRKGTHDTHMARGMGGSPDNVTAPANLTAADVLLAQTAREIQRISGETITVPEAQEMAWSVIRAATEASGKALDDATMHDVMAEMMADSPRVRALLDESDPFSDLLATPERARKLEMMGLNVPEHHGRRGLNVPEGAVRPRDLRNIGDRIQSVRRDDPFYGVAALLGGGALGRVLSQRDSSEDRR